MRPTSARRPAGAIGSFLRFIIAASFGAILLAGAGGESAATSLVVVQERGGPGHGAIARLATDQDVVVSRSVGLMVGASADPAATALGETRIEISRSVGLMVGAPA